jgi:hypothetical protein
MLKKMGNTKDKHQSSMIALNSSRSRGFIQ